MRELLTFINKLKLSEQFVVNKAVEYITKNDVATIIEDYNKKQLSEGVDAEGEQMGVYSPRRKHERNEAGKQTYFIDLNFTGDFYESIEARGELKGNKASLVLDSIQDKWEEIKNDKQDRFKDALGLTQENADKVAVMMSEYISKELNKYYSA